MGLSYGIPQLEKRVLPLAAEIGCTFVEKCDVTSDEEIDAVFARAAEHFGTIDILVHAVAYAPSSELEGRFYNTTREGFRIAMDISAYSFIALAQRARALMPNGGNLVTMTYYGAEKVVPHYNVMGVAKAALEASTRYLAADLGPEGIRVNAISAGPVSYTHLRAHETVLDLVCRLLLEKQNQAYITGQNRQLADISIASLMAHQHTTYILYNEPKGNCT